MPAGSSFSQLGFNPFNPWATPESALAYNRLNHLPDNFRPNPGILSFSDAPQGQNESNLEAGLRQGIAGIGQGVENAANWLRAGLAPPSLYSKIGKPFGDAVVQAFQYAGDTPQAQKARAQQATAASARQQAAPASAAFSTGKSEEYRTKPLTSYKDPRWTDMAAAVASQVGIPAGLLNAVRLSGERSNEGQVSSAGARGVYQITPVTRALIKAKYGFDPLSSAYNETRGAALLLKEGMDRNGGDPAAAVSEYYGGTNHPTAGSARFADINNYTNRVMQAFQGGFDPSYGNQALATLSGAEQAALKPQTFEGPDLSGAPQMPVPEDMPQADFSKVDAALEKLKPAELSEKEQLQIRRDGWMKGIGEALMHLEDGAGLGRVLAAVGGGALAGAASGNEEVRARKDKFDEEMARYNVAVANNETAKAQSIQATLAHNVAAHNAYALNKFKTDYDQFSKTHFMTATGDAVITSTVKDGKQQLTRTPIAAAVAVPFATAKASVLESMGAQNNQAVRERAQFGNTLILSQASQAMANQSATTEDRAAGGVLGLATAAHDVVTGGQVQQLLGDDAFKQVQGEVVKTLAGMGLQPGSNNYFEQYQQVMAQRLVQAAASNPQFRKALLDSSGASSAVRIAGQQLDAKTTVTQGPKGTTSRTVY